MRADEVPLDFGGWGGALGAAGRGVGAVGGFDVIAVSISIVTAGVRVGVRLRASVAVVAALGGAPVLVANGGGA